jgi:DnaJ-domain-containing protein 1
VKDRLNKSRRVLEARRWIMGVSPLEFSPHMYIRSSPRGPSRDPYQTLSKEEAEEEEEIKSLVNKLK